MNVLKSESFFSFTTLSCKAEYKHKFNIIIIIIIFVVVIFLKSMWFVKGLSVDLHHLFICQNMYGMENMFFWVYFIVSYYRYGRTVRFSVVRVTFFFDSDKGMRWMTDIPEGKKEWNDVGFNVQTDVRRKNSKLLWWDKWISVYSSVHPWIHIKVN